MWFNPQSTWYLGIWPNETRNLCCFQPTSILGAYFATAEIRLSPIYFCWRLKPTGKLFWTVVYRRDICGNPFCRGGLKKCENPFLLLNVRGLFPNCQNTKFSFVWCVSVWPRQKRDRFSQELVYVDVFPQICTPDVFISHIGYLDFNISLFCQSGGNIASPSHVNHLSGLIKAERLVQTAKTLMPGGLLSLSFPFLSARPTSQLKLYHVFGRRHLNFPPFRVCFAASPAASRRASTLRAGSRTPRTATWPILWSGLLRASLTKFARRAASPRSTSRACTAWSQVE